MPPVQGLGSGMAARAGWEVGSEWKLGAGVRRVDLISEDLGPGVLGERAGLKMMGKEEAARMR